MTTRSVLPSLLGLSLIFGACSSDTTGPNSTPVAPHVPALAVTSNSWVTRADMWSVERYDLATATITDSLGRSTLYAIGGRSATGAPLTKVMAYNVATNVWTLRASLPIPLWGTNGAVAIDGKIYVSGGCAMAGTVSCDYPVRNLYVYDSRLNTWTRKANMPLVPTSSEPFAPSQGPGDHGASGVINGKLYVLTECTEAIEPYYEHCDPALFFRYNPATDKWTVLPRPSGDWYYAVGGVIDQKFYATGYYGQLQVYDPITNHWTTKAPMPNPYIRLGTGTVLRGKLFVMGGERLSDPGTILVGRTIAYDPVTNSWITKARLPTARKGISASKVFVNGQPRIDVVGGIRPGNNIQYVP
jgi:N-acetylneuraminic acid mutarotase